MKKVMLCLLVLFFGVFAYSQGTTILMNWEAKQYMEQEKAKAEAKAKEKADSVAKTIEIEVVRKQKANNKFDTEVFVYCGREGHMMALGNLMRKDSTGKDALDDIIVWLKAIFLNQKFPYETEEQYKQRIECLGLPANQPFK